MARISGSDQNDTLQGTAGDDLVSGRHGVDTLSLAAQASADATFSIDSQGRWVVTTSAAGRDTLSLVEQVQFSDALILVGDNETRVNTTTLDSQFESAIATLAGGGYVVTWTAADDSDGGIFAQRYAADGTAVGMETQVNTTTGGIQERSAIAALADGGYVVTWTSWTISWNQQNDTNSYDTSVYLQRYAADGAAVGGETLINTTTDDFQIGATPVGLPDGGYLVTWTAGGQEGQDGSGNGIYSQRYAGETSPDGSAIPMGWETLINTTILGEQYNSTMAVLADGGYVIAWSSTGQDGSAEGVIAQRYAADGIAVGGETRINSTTAGAQTDAKVVALAGGDYVVIWSSFDQDGSGWGVYSQRYAGEISPDKSAIPMGGETRVNTTMVNSQFDPAAAALVDGGYVVTWSSYNQDTLNGQWGVYAQRYAADGSAVGSESLINVTTSGSQNESAVAALADGGYVVTWTSQGQDGPGSGVYSQRFDANGLRAGHPTLTGGSEDNVLRVSATQGVEIDGGAGNDTLAGGSQGDILRGGSGADTFEFASSGNGIDRIMDFAAGDRMVIAGASFANDPTAGDGTNVGLNEMQVSAANGITKLFIGTDATPGADVVIELVGTFTADQLWSLGGNQIELASPGVSLTGTTANDSLVGGVGNDTLNGGAGNDTMAGGLRNDTYIVDNRNDVIVESANEGIDQVLASATYTLAANVENLTLTGTKSIDATGNGLNNVIVGNGAANKITAGDGADTLTGGLGADTLTGGLGADSFVYGSSAESSAAARDVIVDFTTGSDRIDLSQIDANVLADGNQAFTFIGTAAFSANATGQVRFDSATHMLYASTNADATAEIVIQLTGVQTLTAADIVL